MGVFCETKSFLINKKAAMLNRITVPLLLVSARF